VAPSPPLTIPQRHSSSGSAEPWKSPFRMALASAAAALLKGSQTPLQQLLEDINFQRTKEMRQLLKDGGYRPNPASGAPDFRPNCRENLSTFALYRFVARGNPQGCVCALVRLCACPFRPTFGQPLCFPLHKRLLLLSGPKAGWENRKQLFHLSVNISIPSSHGCSLSLEEKKKKMD